VNRAILVLAWCRCRSELTGHPLQILVRTGTSTHFTITVSILDLVMPAEAGIQIRRSVESELDSGFRRNDVIRHGS